MIHGNRVALAVGWLFAAAASARAATGMLYVKSDPAGAELRIDGTVVGKTPKLVRDLAPGDHEITLSMPDGASTSLTATVHEGRVERLDVELVSLRGKLTIITEPLEALVVVDGIERGRSPLTVDLDVGPHDIICHHDEHGRAKAGIDIRGGENRTIELRLVKPADAWGIAPAQDAPPPQEERPDPRVAERNAFFGAFVPMLASGEFEKAHAWVANEKTKEKRKARSPDDHSTLDMVAAAADALKGRAARAREALEQSVGKKMTLATASGRRSGTVRDVTDRRVELATRIVVNGRVMGETKFEVNLCDLTFEQTEKLAVGWSRGPAGRFARACLALGRDDLLAAKLHARHAECPELEQYVADRRSDARAAPQRAAEQQALSASEAAWQQIAKRLENPRLSARNGLRLVAAIDEFRSDPGHKEYVAANAHAIDEARAAALRPLAKATRAPDDAVECGLHFYKIFPQQMTWHEAKAFAEAQGGHLATISSQKEQDFLVELAREGHGNVWIGMSRAGRGFAWVTGEPVTFRQWAPGEPHNLTGKQNFVILWGAHGYRWDDSQVETPARLVVEWELPRR